MENPQLSCGERRSFLTGLLQEKKMKFEKLKKKVFLQAGIREQYISCAPSKIRNETLRARVSRYLESVPRRLEDGKSILVCGRQGKTEILSILIKHALFNGMEGYYITFHDLMKMQFGDTSISLSLGRSLEDLRLIKILAIDDLDAGISIKSTHVLSYTKSFFKFRQENKLLTHLAATSGNAVSNNHPIVDSVYLRNYFNLTV